MLFAFNRGERLIRVKNKEEVERALKGFLDSSPALPGWVAGHSPGPAGAETTAVAAPSAERGWAEVAASSRGPADGGAAQARLCAPTRCSQLQSSLPWRAGSDPPASRQDGTEVECGPSEPARARREDAGALGGRSTDEAGGPALSVVRPSGPDTSDELSGGRAGAGGRAEPGESVAVRGSPNSVSLEPTRTESGRPARGDNGGAQRGRRPSSVPARRSGGADAPDPVGTGHLASNRGTTGSSDSRGTARPARSLAGLRNARSVVGAGGDGCRERDIRTYWN